MSKAVLRELTKVVSLISAPARRQPWNRCNYRMRSTLHWNLGWNFPVLGQPSKTAPRLANRDGTLREGAASLRRHGFPWESQEIGHLVLPARVDFLPHHSRSCLLKIRSLQVTDQQPVVAQKERVIVPTGFAQRLEHFRPHLLVALLVLRETTLLYVQQKTYSFLTRAAGNGSCRSGQQGRRARQPGTPG